MHAARGDWQQNFALKGQDDPSASGNLSLGKEAEMQPFEALAILICGYHGSECLEAF